MSKSCDILAPGAENAPKIVSKLLEFAELQGVSISAEERAILELLQTNLKEKKETITSLTLSKPNETIALLNRLAAALPLERCRSLRREVLRIGC
jgi:hypothetical protein